MALSICDIVIIEKNERSLGGVILPGLFLWKKIVTF